MVAESSLPRAFSCLQPFMPPDFPVESREAFLEGPIRDGPFGGRPAAETAHFTRRDEKKKLVCDVYRQKAVEEVVMAEKNRLYFER